jgi:hypothetical protein
MKKFALILAGLAFMLALGAQTSGTTYTFAPNETFKTAFTYTHTTKYSATQLKDSIGGATTLYWIFAVNKSQLYYYQFLFEYDTILIAARAAGNHVTFNTYGSIDGTYWTKLDSCLMHPTTSYLPAYVSVIAAQAALTSQSLKDVSTGVLWKYLKFEAVGADANTCSICSKLALKIGLRY